jgi:NADPH:quinone reductase-like Zn-dependent oxidoreductase
MRAVPFFEHGPVEMLRYRDDFPDPVAGSNDAIIDVRYCGVNHLDIWTRQGIAGRRIRLPHVSGCDIVGTVNSARSRGVKPGDRVIVYPGYSCRKCSYCKSGFENLCGQFAIIGGMSDLDGGYAERVAVPARNVIKLPASIKDEVAATLAVSYLTTWNMLSTNGAKKGKTILVHGGASGVGMATIQLAKAIDATVITTASSEAKEEFAKRIGADYVIDRNKEDIAEQARKRTGGGGVDIVIDHVGAATWQTGLSALRQGGRMAVCGMTSGNEATVPVRMFYTKQIVMTGALLGTRAQLVELINFVARKKIRPVIDSIFPLAEAREAQLKMEAGRHMGKILLKCN